jgi:hypothetical protein
MSDVEVLQAAMFQFMQQDALPGAVRYFAVPTNMLCQVLCDTMQCPAVI